MVEYHIQANTQNIVENNLAHIARVDMYVKGRYIAAVR